MDIIEASHADFADVLDVERRAFGGEEEANLVADLLTDATARPLLSLVARRDGRPVGHVLFTAVRIEGADVTARAAILAPLAVVPEAQRQGVGTELIASGIAHLAHDGVALVFVLGDPGYYGRHGFKPASPLGFVPPYTIVPDEAWMVRELLSGTTDSTGGRVICADVLNRPELWRE